MNMILYLHIHELELIQSFILFQYNSNLQSISLQQSLVHAKYWNEMTYTYTISHFTFPSITYYVLWWW